MSKRYFSNSKKQHKSIEKNYKKNPNPPLPCAKIYIHLYSISYFLFRILRAIRVSFKLCFTRFTMPNGKPHFMIESELYAEIYQDTLAPKSTDKFLYSRISAFPRRNETLHNIYFIGEKYCLNHNMFTYY
jgi:hypothetical protein